MRPRQEWNRRWQQPASSRLLLSLRVREPGQVLPVRLVRARAQVAQQVPVVRGTGEAPWVLMLSVQHSSGSGAQSQ